MGLIVDASENNRLLSNAISQVHLTKSEITATEMSQSAVSGRFFHYLPSLVIQICL